MMGGLTLTMEDEPSVVSPTKADLLDAIIRMTPEGGPSFLILERDNGDYVQAAGGTGVFTAEWREFTGATFRHWKAGRGGSSTMPETAVPTNGFIVSVRANEVLDGMELLVVLQAFLLGARRPTRLNWRDMMGELT